MKKHLLAIAGAMLATVSASAQVVEPQVVENMLFSAMSPNGKWVAGSNPFTYGLDIMNLETGDVYNLEPEGWDEEYTLGTGVNSVANDGTVLISTSSLGNPCYVKDGEIFVLPYDNYTSAYANAITPNGYVIAGMVGQAMTTDDVTMQTPALWYRNPDGTYGQPILLDYPKTDFTGRVPQYILVDGISADGTVLACQIHDYVGTIDQPLVYRLTSEGWKYEVFGDNFINPNGYEFPEVGPRPNALDYMTDEEKAAYLEALALAETLEEPNPLDFMDEDQIAAYLEAMQMGWAWAPDYMTEEQAAAYEEAQDYYWTHKYVSAENFIQENAEEYFAADEAWQELNGEVEMAYWQCVEAGKIFLMNTLCLSPDAKYYATAVSSIDPETLDEAVSPVVYDLATMTPTEMATEESMIIPSYVANNGSLLLAKPATYFDPVGKAFYAKSANDEILPLEEVIGAINPDLYNFMEENMVHAVATEDWIYDPELDDWIIEYTEGEAEFITGQPCCDAEMKTIATWSLNNWDFDSDAFAYSYVLPLEKGIATGITNNTSNAATTEHYDLQGRRLTTPTNTGIVITRHNGQVTKHLK